MLKISNSKKKNQKEKKEECEKVKKEENENVKKEENEKLIKVENEKLRNENEQLRKKNVVKDATITELIKIKSLEKDKKATSFPNWFDKISLKTFQLLLRATHLITDIKYVNSSILTLKT